MAKVEQQKINREIKAQLYDSLRDALSKPVGKSGKSWTENYIQIMLKEAKENPSGPIGQWIARQLMQEDIISKLDEATDKAMARDIDFLEYRLLKQLYDKQRDVFLDDHIHRKIIIGSRRIGKTTLATRLLVKDAIKPNHSAVFISLKFENAINQAYDETVAMAETIGLVISKKSRNEGIIQFTNGSRIIFKGNHDKDALNGFQGYKFSLVIIDECQTQRNLKALLEDIIGPAMSDYEDATLVLTGTPPRIKGTMAEKIWNEYKGWKHYAWDMRSNPYIKNVDEVIKQRCEEKGVDENAPFIRREYYGEWVIDMEAQVYKGATKHKEVPGGFIPTDIYVGVDFGFSDYNSLISLACNRETKRGYVINERKFNQSTVSDVVLACRETYDLCKKFAIEHNKNFDFQKIGFYCDTSDQMIVHELSVNYKLPAYACYKHDKSMAISQLADWLRSGRMSVPEGGILDDEFDRTVYKRDDQDNILPEIDDDLFHPDACDALLYASRQYAYDCGEDSGGQSSDKTEKEETRNQTLPDWFKLPNEEEGDNNYGY